MKIQNWFWGGFAFTCGSLCALVVMCKIGEMLRQVFQ